MIRIAALLLSALALSSGGPPVVPAVEKRLPAQQPAGAQATRPVPDKPAANADAYRLFLDARQHEIDGDIDGAIKLYQEAAQVDPASGAILAELAGLYARQNRVRDAVSTAEAALKVKADTVEAHAILGSIYAMYAQGEQAGKTAAASAAEKDYAARAITHLEAVLNARGATTAPDMLLTLGRLYLRVSAPEKAIPVLARFSEQEPDAMDGIALLTDAYTRAGRADEAITLLDRSAQRQPDFYPVLANLYERAGRWQDAAGAYQKAVQAGMTSPEVKRRWAAALLNARRPGDAARARDLLQQLVGASAKDTRAMYLLAQAQRDLNDYAAAEATARQLIAADPRGASGPLALAEVYEQQNEYRKVVETLQPVVDRIGPQDEATAGMDLTPVLLHLGFAYLDLKRYDEAEGAFKQVLSRDPLHSQALNYLGYMLADRGLRLPEAVEYIRRALTVEPNNPAYLDSLGWAYFKMNRLDLAEPNLRRAVSDRPNDSAVQDHWGDLLLKLGRRGEAVTAWRRALAGDGQDIDRAAIEAKIRASEKK